VRRLVVALTGVLTLVGVVVVLLYLFVFTGAGDRAARIVPADTVAYVNVYLQPSAGQQMELSALIGRFPGFRDLDTLDAKIDQLAQRFLTAAGIDYTRQLRPWLGSQLALAVAPFEAGAQPVPLLVVAVKDRAEAERSVAEIAEAMGERALARQEHRGVAMLVGHDLSYAFIDDLLVVASAPDRVRSAIDVARGGMPSLADEPAFRSAMRRLPADHLASAYLDLPALVGAEGGSLAGVSDLSLALRAEDAGLHVVGYAPVVPEADGPPIAGGTPTLAGWMPADTEAALVVFGLSGILETLEGEAGRIPELTDLATTLVQLRAMASLGLGIDVEADLMPLLDGEVGVGLMQLGGQLTGQLVLRPSDPSIVAPILERLRAALEERGADISTRSIGPDRITLVDAPQLGSFAYGAADGVVIAGLEIEPVRSALESHRSGPTLAAEPRYRGAFELAGTPGRSQAYIDADAVLRMFGDALPLSEADRDILHPIDAIGLALEMTESQIEIHLVMTIS
jgi:hypothetical protein